MSTTYLCVLRIVQEALDCRNLLVYQRILKSLTLEKSQPIDTTIYLQPRLPSSLPRSERVVS